MQSKFRKLLCLILLVAVAKIAGAAAPTFNCYITNDQVLNGGTTLQWDVYMVKTGGSNFHVKTMQYSFALDGSNFIPSISNYDPCPLPQTPSLTSSGTYNRNSTTTLYSGVTNNNAAVNWILDADGDHYYTGSAVSACVSPGAEYTKTGLIGGNDY